MNELATRGTLAHVRAVVPAYGRPDRTTPVTRPQRRRDTGAGSKRWQTLARAGWAAKGSLYVTFGGLAFLAAVGEGEQLLGTKGVLAWVLDQPFGRLLLFLAAVGLACYALWQCARAIHRPASGDSTGDSTDRLARVGAAVRGLLHAALGVAAFQMLAGGGFSGGTQTWIGRLMSVGPVGTGLVTMAGLAVIGVGLYQFKRAADLDFMDDLGTRRFSLGEFRALRIIGRIGHASRGVVLPIIGSSLARAAFVHDPNQAQGTGGAVAELAQTSWILLALIAVGLMAYGVLNLVFARVRCAQVHV